MSWALFWEAASCAASQELSSIKMPTKRFITVYISAKFQTWYLFHSVPLFCCLEMFVLKSTRGVKSNHAFPMLAYRGSESRRVYHEWNRSAEQCVWTAPILRNWDVIWLKPSNLICETTSHSLRTQPLFVTLLFRNELLECDTVETQLPDWRLKRRDGVNIMTCLVWKT
jgi:hypothetical protein